MQMLPVHGDPASGSKVGKTEPRTPGDEGLSPVRNREGGGGVKMLTMAELPAWSSPAMASAILIFLFNKQNLKSTPPPPTSLNLQEFALRERNGCVPFSLHYIRYKDGYKV